MPVFIKLWQIDIRGKKKFLLRKLFSMTAWCSIYFSNNFTGCGHCKSAKPEFTEAAAKFRDDPKVEFAAVDCTTQQNLCTANDVKGYPTIKYFSYSKTVKLYTGSRSAENFINFMANPESKSQPSVNKDEWVVDAKTIIQLTDNTFKKEISSEEPVLVMFYAPCKYVDIYLMFSL